MRSFQFLLELMQACGLSELVYEFEVMVGFKAKNLSVGWLLTWDEVTYKLSPQAPIVLAGSVDCNEKNLRSTGCKIEQDERKTLV